jgi:hypothetical protein
MWGRNKQLQDVFIRKPSFANGRICGSSRKGRVIVFDPKHHVVEANGIRIHVAEQGEGPVVLFCHGFPESWYSWRHQLLALAEAGFRAVAPDMRGYGIQMARQGHTHKTDFHRCFPLVHMVRLSASGLSNNAQAVCTVMKLCPAIRNPHDQVLFRVCRR